jgi:N-methylhydantoinase A/oxoprolinase/acetone carboxylase beta subunit
LEREEARDAAPSPHGAPEEFVCEPEGFRGIIRRGEVPAQRRGREREFAPGNRVEGPAIIRDPMTIAVIPPGCSIELDAYRIRTTATPLETDR